MTVLGQSPHRIMLRFWYLVYYHDYSELRDEPTVKTAISTALIMRSPWSLSHLRGCKQTYGRNHQPSVYSTSIHLTLIWLSILYKSTSKKHKLEHIFLCQGFRRVCHHIITSQKIWLKLITLHFGVSFYKILHNPISRLSYSISLIIPFLDISWIFLRYRIILNISQSHSQCRSLIRHKPTSNAEKLPRLAPGVHIQIAPELLMIPWINWVDVFFAMFFSHHQAVINVIVVINGC